LLSRRVYILVGLFGLAFLVLLGRLAQVQILWHDRFDLSRYTRASGNHLVETVRGGIYTRWGTPLARQVPAFDLAVSYDDLPKDEWKEQVSRLCGVPREKLEEKAQRIIRRVERIRRAVEKRTGMERVRVVEQNQAHPVVRDVPPEVAAAVRAAPEAFPGIVIHEGARREYPNGALAPHVVGGVNDLNPEQWKKVCREGRQWTGGMPLSQIGARYKMDDRIGSSGMEKEYEDLLRGRRGYVRNYLAFGLLKVEKVSREAPPEPGCDVYLTLREDFQRAANEALQRASGMPQLDFDRGALVIVDVKSGAVLAAATFPSYDLSTYRERLDEIAKDKERAPFLFRPVQAALPTGSVYKVITAIAGLEEGAITPATTFTCHRREVFEGRAFHCTGSHGTLALLEAIERSCNIYFYHTALAAGGPALTRWGRRFGLGMPTGVDFPFETTGRVPEAHATFQVINLAIGQGKLLCTPLQVANMMAAVANGGRLYRPHFFHHASNSEGEIVREQRPQFKRIALHETTLSAVREGMRLVAQKRGTARHADLERFRVAGKTGTAEQEASGLNHAWFAGYAPYENPKIAFAVVSESTTGHGGSHAAPILGMALERIWDEVERMQ